MKILLFVPSFETPAKQEGASYPLGIIYLASVLEKAGHEVKGFDYLWEEWEKVMPEIEEKIRTENPQIIMISCMTTNRTASFELVKLVKQISKEIIVVIGGVHASLMHKQILENFPVDFIVIGEGEATIKELVWLISQEPKRWKKFKNLKESPFKVIRGIAYKVKGKITKTGPRLPIKDLDSIPFPKHTFFSRRIRKSNIAFIITSRGCPIGCTFCSTCNFWGRQRRQRTPENVIKEIKFLKRRFKNLKKIYFNDDEFIINQEWVFKFCELVKKENIEWECVARVSSVSENLLEKMKKAGCKRIGFGVESGSPKILNSIKKGITREQVINAFKLCEKLGIEAAMFLMVGLPGETKETINETISLLKETRNAEFRIPAIFQVFPGNEIYEEIKEKGLITDGYWFTDNLAPLYTYEHSKRKLFYWALKIAFYHKLYRHELGKFFFSSLKQLRPDKIKRIINQYLKNKNVQIRK